MLCNFNENYLITLIKKNPALHGCREIVREIIAVQFCFK